MLEDAHVLKVARQYPEKFWAGAPPEIESARFQFPAVVRTCIQASTKCSLLIVGFAGVLLAQDGATGENWPSYGGTYLFAPVSMGYVFFL